jgi:hypothetical protein
MKERKPTPITPTIYHAKDFSYIKISEVPVELREEFNKFMYGQTMPCIENEKGEFSTDAVYSWDYINFLNKLFGRPSFVD